MPAPDHRRGLFVSACAGILVFGIVLALLGTLFGLEGTRARFHINLAQQGDLLLLLFFGIFLSTLAVGPLTDRLGSRPVLFVSALGVGLALVGFSLALAQSGTGLTGGFGIAAGSSVLLGLGGGGLNTTTNALVSELYGDERGPRLNALGIFFGAGALLMPLVAATLLSVLSPQALMLSAAGLAFACAVAYGGLRFPPAKESQGFSWLEAARVARYPNVLLFAALLFFQSGNEASIGGWVSTYAGAIGAKARAATWILAGYWAAMMLGRALAAKLLGRMSKYRLLLLGGLGSVAGCALLLAADSVARLAVASVATGLAFAGIYPTVLAMAGDRYARFAGTVFSLLFSIALVGGMLVPWGIGQLAQVRGVRLGMVLPLGGAAMVSALVVWIERRERSVGGENAS